MNKFTINFQLTEHSVQMLITKNKYTLYSSKYCVLGRRLINFFIKFVLDKCTRYCDFY